MIDRSEIAAVILAGGKATRLQQVDKALLPLDGKALIEHVVAHARTESAEILISVNRNREKYEYLGLTLIADYRDPFAGPLIGIASAMRALQGGNHVAGLKYLACFAADVPCFPSRLVSKLSCALSHANAEVAWSICNDQLQPLFSLWALSTLPEIETAIENGIYGPKLLIPKLKNVLVNFPSDDPAQFLNINTQESYDRAKSLIES
ncbi:MAG TPA: molybdenum cofactor guanylyltransferase [Gammaproteobacteria bacterium]|jgi:molybdenum cofactor guanylyltransferase|nr:molybdenum cofactor guanylyltransferase [Gammaproteobacteria bacterium]HIF86949.1 molybdenum cofactor guanylyltransferase [Gammaproteobacteria bacterium]HIL64180.1 molybdenum cofactor guanylyltransferase [Porticoccaceae bacterium]HIN91113.1 molybdenum cofactor guanylyltransferase [Porticoccaceae bacterium]|tara:strand:+ start:7133 stop:7753 length:621 start_codon:yes stop_codon:yes gene_type:complete